MTFTGKALYTDQPLPEMVDDVSDLVGLISPFDTPLLDAIGNPHNAAKSTRHEWPGGENFTQIFTETVTISGSMDAVGLHAVEREFDYQVIQRLRELMRSLEQTVIQGFKASIKDADTAQPKRTMGGLLQFITTNITDALTEPLTEPLLTAALKNCYEKGGRPNAIVCNGFQKRRINAFIGSDRKYEPESTALRNVVDVYESDFGTQRVILSRWVPADKLLLLDLDKLQVMPLQGRSFHMKPLTDATDLQFRKAQLIGEYTLEILNGDDGGHGVIANLATE